jgi:uncharacterized protein YjbI with pentapeptide repeats
LSRARLVDANLNGADLSDASLVEANFSNAEMRGANVEGAEMTRTILPDGMTYQPSVNLAKYGIQGKPKVS